MIGHKGSGLSWAPFRAGRFGTGHLLAVNTSIVQVWLPVVDFTVERAAGEVSRAGHPAAAVEFAPAGFAHEVAPRFEAYLRAGESLDGVPFTMPPARAFTARVQQLCLAIPRGETRTYQDLATAAGSPLASRAVGQVMRTNPLPLLIPCHRVVNTESRVVRYGGGAEMKLHLLELERRV